MAVAAGLLAATAACSPATSCTDMGAESHVLLETGDAALEGTQVQVCLGQDCVVSTWSSGLAHAPLPLPLEGTVQLTIGTAGADDDVEAAVVARTPNGPGCEPRIGTVRLRRGPAGSYEQVVAVDAR